MNKQGHDLDGKDNISVSIGGNAVGNAIGSNASVSSNNIVNGNDKSNEQVSEAFRPVLDAIKARSDDPKVDKEEIIEVVQDLLNEVRETEQPDENVIKRRLRAIARMAPDILEVIVESFSIPGAGIISLIGKIAVAVKAEM